MYRNLSILQFYDIYRLNILKFLHYSLYKNQTFFNKYFLPLLPTHHYNTRNVRINLPNVRLDIEKHSALYNSCMLMNQIDETFLSQMSDYMLKKKFKDKCISSYWGKYIWKWFYLLYFLWCTFLSGLLYFIWIFSFFLEFDIVFYACEIYFYITIVMKNCVNFSYQEILLLKIFRLFNMCLLLQLGFYIF